MSQREATEASQTREDDLSRRLEALVASIADQQVKLKHSREAAALLREEIHQERRDREVLMRRRRLDEADRTK
jgi:hypothetical protein